MEYSDAKSSRELVDLQFEFFEIDHLRGDSVVMSKNSSLVISANKQVISSDYLASESLVKLNFSKVNVNLLL